MDADRDEDGWAYSPEARRSREERRRHERKVRKRAVKRKHNRRREATVGGRIK